MQFLSFFNVQKTKLKLSKRAASRDSKNYECKFICVDSTRPMSTALDALPLSPFQQALERGGGEGYEEAVASSPAKCSRIATFRNSQIKFGLRAFIFSAPYKAGSSKISRELKCKHRPGKRSVCACRKFLLRICFCSFSLYSLEREKKFD